MPIIKDKYGAKGDNARSKFVRREFADKRVSDTNFSAAQENSMLSTQQKQSIRAQEIKEITSVNEAGDLTGLQQESLFEINGVRLTTADTVYQLAEIPKGGVLKDIILSLHNTDTNSSVVSIVWSETALADLSVSSSSGVITGTACFRLFTDTMPHNSSISLSNSGLIDTFSKLSGTIYIYAASQRTGVDTTIIKHNG